jgi:PAS domain-containing protein
MFRDHALAKLIRRWGFAVSAGAIGLAMGIAAINLLHLDGIFQILTDIPAVGLSIILVLDAVAVGALFTAIEERRQNRAARVALDNMTQGLGMFDSAARLVLCNKRYIEMSQLPPEIFRKGTSLRDILMRRYRPTLLPATPIYMSLVLSKRWLRAAWWHERLNLKTVPGDQPAGGQLPDERRARAGRGVRVPEAFAHEAVARSSSSNSRPRIGHHSGQNGPSKAGWGGGGGYHH